MIKTVYIIPTGDEIREGIVLDLDSPEIMKQVLAFEPEAQIIRIGPIVDDERKILEQLEKIVEQAPDLVVLIGGSGGGHRFSETLGKDYTHSALEQYLTQCAKHEIYGKNGHLWCKLLCGKRKETTIINVPGPFVEAQAAICAYLTAVKDGKGLNGISHAMAQAVFDQYPSGAAEEPV